MPTTAYRIHPSIGIARVGTSRTESFDGPLVPDIHFLPAPDGKFRDGEGNIRRQGVKFFVYEFTYEDAAMTTLTSVRRLTAKDADIKWTVHLANLKSRTVISGAEVPVPNDPGAKPVDIGSTPVNVVGHIFGTDVRLGTLEAVDAATLRVLPGFGENGPAGTPNGFGLWWNDWFDDVADGPVQAQVTLKSDQSKPSVTPAWVVTGVSKFATPMTPMVTMYDVAYDIAVRHFSLAEPPEVSFTRDIYPILHRAVFFQWVEADSLSGHGPGEPGDFLESTKFALLTDADTNPTSAAFKARKRVFGKLKNPAGGPGGNMPLLIGTPSAQTPSAIGLTLTPTQYKRFKEWSDGSFNPDWTGVPAVIPFDALPAAAQPEALDRASLETGVGGTFAPGIEVGHLFSMKDTFGGPFRINTAKLAGYLTSELSVPWQVDFDACAHHWWPSNRPYQVMKADHSFDWWARFAAGEDMLHSWWKLKFLRREVQPTGEVFYPEES